MDFDQCRTGLETTKPTRLLIKRIKLDHLKGLRCNHERRERTRPDGSTYVSAHETVVQRWVDGPTGRVRASKEQGEYTITLCKAIARAFQETLDADKGEKDEEVPRKERP